PLAERLLKLPEDRRPQAVVCHSAAQAEVLMEIFAALGLPLQGAGAGEETYRGLALLVRASNTDMGKTAAALLLWKLQNPERPPLRVGVPMVMGMGGKLA